MVVAEFIRDLTFGIRLLAKSPVFTATAALLLAVGISANTLIYSVVDALLLRSPAVSRPENLVRLRRSRLEGQRMLDVRTRLHRTARAQEHVGQCPLVLRGLRAQGDRLPVLRGRRAELALAREEEAKLLVYLDDSAA